MKVIDLKDELTSNDILLLLFIPSISKVVNKEYLRLIDIRSIEKFGQKEQMFWGYKDKSLLKWAMFSQIFLSKKRTFDYYEILLSSD